MTSVAFNADQAFYRIPGGIGTYQRELVPAMAAVDPELDVTLFHARFDEPPPEWMTPFPRIRLQRRHEALYVGWALLRRPPLPEPLRRLDVLHTPSPAVVPPPGPGQRLVVTVHDLAFKTHPDVFPPPWRRLFRAGLRRSVRTADALIAPSRHTADDLVRLAAAPPSRVHVVPLGPSLRAKAGDPEEALRRLGVAPPYVLYVGTLEPRKNVARLVRGYREAVARTRLPHSLVLAGPLGWKPEALDRELRRDGPGRILRTGHVSAEDLDALYRCADVFAYPSLYEGFGLPVLDALARGVPTIAARSSAIPEVTGDAAVLVDPGSTEEIAAAMERLLSDEEERRRLGEAGRRRAHDFSWERAARETIEVYRSLL